MTFAQQGLNLMDMVHARVLLQRLAERAAAAGRPELAGSCDVTAAEISRWIEEAMPTPRSRS